MWIGWLWKLDSRRICSHSKCIVFIAIKSSAHQTLIWLFENEALLPGLLITLSTAVPESIFCSDSQFIQSTKDWSSSFIQAIELNCTIWPFFKISGWSCFFGCRLALSPLDKNTMDQEIPQNTELDYANHALIKERLGFLLQNSRLLTEYVLEVYIYVYSQFLLLILPSVSTYILPFRALSDLTFQEQFLISSLQHF